MTFHRQILNWNLTLVLASRKNFTSAEDLVNGIDGLDVVVVGL